MAKAQGVILDAVAKLEAAATTMIAAATKIAAQAEGASDVTDDDVAALNAAISKAEEARAALDPLTAP